MVIAQIVHFIDAEDYQIAAKRVADPEVKPQQIRKLRIFGINSGEQAAVAAEAVAETEQLQIFVRNRRDVVLFQLFLTTDNLCGGEAAVGGDTGNLIDFIDKILQQRRPCRLPVIMYKTVSGDSCSLFCNSRLARVTVSVWLR